MTHDRHDLIDPLGTDICERCGEAFTPDESSAGICARCAEDERNRNFVEVEVDDWNESQE